MRVLRIAVALCVFSIFALPARSQSNTPKNMGTGNYLIAACQAAVTAQDHPNSLKTASDEYKIGYCFGMAYGVSDTLLGSQRAQRACVPDGVTAGQEARIIEKYLKDHPAQLNLPSPFLVGFAIEKAFPCK